MRDRPARLTLVSIEPRTPRPDEFVTFTFRWSDPDADLPFLELCRPGDGCPAPPLPPCVGSTPTGPWTAPAPRGASGELTKRVRFKRAGTYKWWSMIDTVSSSYEDLAAAHPSCPLDDPYASRAILKGEITIADPSD